MADCPGFAGCRHPCHARGPRASLQHGAGTRDHQYRGAAAVVGNCTMLCQACDTENITGSRFCIACGVAFVSACAACGRDCPETARFCAWCGTPRKPGARMAGVPGERKQATVMFADIAGSTARIAGLDAEGAMNSLQPAVMAMVRAV